MRLLSDYLKLRQYLEKEDECLYLLCIEFAFQTYVCLGNFYIVNFSFLVSTLAYLFLYKILIQYYYSQKTGNRFSAVKECGKHFKNSTYMQSQVYY